jgi:chemotaxis protein CheC
VTPAWPLTEAQRDALCELANVGAGHAATSLSHLLSGQRVAFQAPEVWGFTLQGWQARLEKEAPWLAAVHEVHGAAGGTLWLLFAQTDSQALATQMASAVVPPAEASVDAAVHRAAQTMGVSALSAMGRLTGLTLSSGEPVLRRSALSAPLPFEADRAPGLVLEVRLRAPSLAAQFLLLPATASVGPLLHSLRV